MRPCRGWIGTPGALSKCNNEGVVDKIRVLDALEGLRDRCFSFFL